MIDAKRKDRAAFVSDTALKEWLSNADRARNDSNKDQRLALRKCMWCFYAKKTVAGAAFTPYTCHSCKSEYMHHNTNVPFICQKCADENSCCTECLAPLQRNDSIQVSKRTRERNQVP